MVVMSQGKLQSQSTHKSILRRLWEQIVPPMIDFHALLQEQCINLQTAVAVVDSYLQQADPLLAPKLREEVREGHRLRDRNLALLYSTFITPIDREDIYTLSMTIDHILDYVKNTMRELEVLQVKPDDCMRNMVEQLGKGAISLAHGLELFQQGRASEIREAVVTRQLERYVEKLYREVLAEMFQGPEYQALTGGGEQTTALACLDFVVERMKRREVYRHLSNAADRMAHAGEALSDISIKYE
jgi:uncharacterized protein Yka (UPF0111/DUF47 family)